MVGGGASEHLMEPSPMDGDDDGSPEQEEPLTLVLSQLRQAFGKDSDCDR